MKMEVFMSIQPDNDDGIGMVLVLKPKNNIWLIKWDCPDCAKRNILKRKDLNPPIILECEYCQSRFEIFG